ncbi:MAG: DUF192 domain-containing protein [Thermacetogeniaceae bacterium]|jgi:uncharacterized membrane protein (UPF0127 family)
MPLITMRVAKIITSAVVKGDVSMEIYNITQGVVLAQEVEICFSFWKRFKGLLGRRSFPVGTGLLLKPCKSVHSYFVRFPFDAVFLNEDMVIVHIMESMPPYRISPVIWDAVSVLELPAGIARLSGSRVGDQLSLRTQFT